MGLTIPLLPLWGSCRKATEGASALKVDGRVGGGSPLHRFAVPLPLRGRN